MDRPLGIHSSERSTPRGWEVEAVYPTMRLTFHYHYRCPLAFCLLSARLDLFRVEQDVLKWS